MRWRTGLASDAVRPRTAYLLSVVLIGAVALLGGLLQRSPSPPPPGDPAWVSAPKTLVTAEPSASTQAEPPDGDAESTTDSGAPTRVRLGVYLNEIQSIDLTENAYTVDFYLWLTWTGDLDPSSTLDFVNEDAKAFPRSRPFDEEPQVLPDGRKYQGWHVLSTFKSLFNFADYPRDRHVLTIEVEDNSHDAKSIVYEVANADVQYDTGSRNILGGWRMVRTPWATVGETVYHTGFGEPSAGKATTYSRATFNLELSRPATGYLTKSITPITIVILMTMLTFLIGTMDLASRLGVCITALISAVVLHSESTSELPTVGYFVLFDWVYILAYLAIFVTLLESILVHRAAAAGKATLARRLDLVVGPTVTLLYIGGVALIALA